MQKAYPIISIFDSIRDLLKWFQRYTVLLCLVGLVLLSGCTTLSGTAPTETTQTQAPTTQTPNPEISPRLKLVSESTGPQTVSITLRREEGGSNSTVLDTEVNLTSGESVDFTDEFDSESTYFVDLSINGGEAVTHRISNYAGYTFVFENDGRVRIEKETV